MAKLITALPYMYRDAANYKANSVIYLQGRLTCKHIALFEHKLESGDGFIPFDLQLGISELQCQLVSFPNEDDHVFHEFDFKGRKFIQSVPAGETAIELNAFISAFDRISDETAWDISGAERRLGLPQSCETE